jgi:dUTP pyrophosphatase
MSRSGLAKNGVFVANAPGIVDPDYSGELIILLYNGSYETHYVAHEHRIAQLILTPIWPCAIGELDILPPPVGRGDRGFGSTGL